MGESSLKHDSSTKHPTPGPRKIPRSPKVRPNAASPRQPSAAKALPEPRDEREATRRPAPSGAAPDPPERITDAPQSSAWRRALRGMPSWLASLLFHLAVLLALGLFTLSVQRSEPDMSLISSADTSVDEPLEELVEDAVPVEMEELPEQPAMSDASDPGAIQLGDVAAVSTEAISAVGVGELSDPVGDIGALFGSEGQGMAKAGMGDGGATFFGVKTKGRKFIFVVDNSNSMGQGRFETAVAEIINAVGKLDKTQYFYVVFYSDTAYPLFYPQSSPRMLPATPENKQQLVYWLSTVQMCLRTNGEEAMNLALSLNPDAIYLLGDGAFGDKTIPKTMALDRPSLTIHTMGFDMKPKDAQRFEMLATKFKGKFTEAEVPNVMKELDRQLKRPRNQTRSGVWGVKLPANK